MIFREVFTAIDAEVGRVSKPAAGLQPALPLFATPDKSRFETGLQDEILPHFAMTHD